MSPFQLSCSSSVAALLPLTRNKDVFPLLCRSFNHLVVMIISFRWSAHSWQAGHKNKLPQLDVQKFHFIYTIFSEQNQRNSWAMLVFQRSPRSHITSSSVAALPGCNVHQCGPFSAREFFRHPLQLIIDSQCKCWCNLRLLGKALQECSTDRWQSFVNFPIFGRIFYL